MKTNNRFAPTILAALLLFCMAATVRAQFTFTTNNGAITITRYTGYGGNVVIPSSTNGYLVTSIGTGAFDSSKVVGVTIPTTITNIGSTAFASCLFLHHITIPDSVTAIGALAFRVSGLSDAFIGAGVNSIGDSAFYGCSILSLITVDPQNTNFSSMDGVLFDKSQTAPITYPQRKAGAYTLPETVTCIASNVFQGCGLLTGITIPRSVTNIGIGAFADCPNLTAIIVEPSNAFYGSMNGVLFDANLVTLVQYPIGNASNSYTVPNSVTNIERSAFQSCTNLTNVTIPDSVVILADSAFDYCTGLTNVAIGNRVSSIGDSAFNNCTMLTSVTIGNNVTSIGNHAFSTCTALNGVDIPDSVTNIGERAFQVCTSLSSLTFGTNLVSIGYGAFYGCTGLTNLVVPDSVADIEDWAFLNCQNLTNIIVGKGVVSIGSLTFGSCYRLQRISFQGNAPNNIGDDAIYANSYLKVYYQPGTTGWGLLFSGYPTAPWPLPYPVILDNSADFGLQTNAFGFTICWNTNILVLVEACTDLANPTWRPRGTNTLINGLSWFCDPQYTNNPTSFYRVRAP